MDVKEVMQVLRKTGAVMEGHFRLTSGKHSDFYVQCAILMQYPEEVRPLCEQLAGAFMRDGVEAVVGPATGAIIMSYEIARALGVRAMFAERDNNEMTLRRGFSIRPGERVLVVEDVVTTGGSVMEVAAAIKAMGGIVVGVAAFVDRSGGQVRFDVPFQSLATLQTNVYDPKECPLCRQGLPAVKPGSRQV